MARKPEELTGVFSSVRWRNKEGDFMIGALDDKTCVLGPISEDNMLLPGIKYRFVGFWIEDDRYGRQFKFQAFIAQEPASRNGVVNYLETFAPGVGMATAHRLCDLYGADRAIEVLKTNPEQVARDIRHFKLDKARAASKILCDIEHFQETRVRLMDLFTGRGFPGALIEKCIEKWKVHAPDLVKRDPFRLLVSRLPGCGFLRVDRLYTELGHPPDKMKRQVMACWHVLHSDMSGSVWYSRDDVVRGMSALVSGQRFKPDRAIEIARRAELIVVIERDGREWIADADAAVAEQYISEKLMELV